ncbi:MAG: SEC-C domain-containing protein [Planctomycetes bacterium]|nr:SEC-C domain-containing protein [Planctomycetota bacterium]
MSWDEAKECLTKEPIGVSHEYRDPPRIDDTIGELHTWASFREPEPRTSKPHWPEPPFPAPAPKRASPSRPATPTAVAPFQSRDRVGRNDPCPCGSGKKFKRCCGGRRGTAN